MSLPLACFVLPSQFWENKQPIRCRCTDDYDDSTPVQQSWQAQWTNTQRKTTVRSSGWAQAYLSQRNVLLVLIANWRRHLWWLLLKQRAWTWNVWKKRTKSKKESKSWSRDLNACAYVTKIERNINSWIEKTECDRQSHVFNCPKWKRGQLKV